MILLDTRELDHPIPLEMAVNAFKHLQDDEVIHMIHRREPIPLFEIITKNGGRYLSYEDSDQVWHIYITRNGDLEPYRV
jgi:TusA-related sulfurtransferase